MSELISLYTNLFVMTISFVGILLASIIALTQLLEPLLVSRSAQKIVRPATLFIATILLSVSSILSVAGMAILSLKNHNFFPDIDLHINDILSNPIYVIVSVAVVLASGAFVVAFIYQVSRLLIPVNALKYLVKSSKKGVITNFFNKTGATQPMRPHRFTMLYDEESQMMTVGEGDEESDREAQRKYEADLKQYELDKKKLSKMENPLFPIETYLTRAIQRSNLTIITNTLKSFEQVIEIHAKDNEFKQLTALIDYYRTVLENAHELAIANGLQSASLELIESSARISDILIANSRYEALLTLESHWRTLASEALNVRPAIFKRSVSILGEVARTVLRDEGLEWAKIQDLIDNIMRGLGWLGERLLDAGAPEKRELMLNDNETQFNALMNAVLNLGWEMNSHRSDVYPLIYFDCLYVIAKKLAPYCETDSEYDGDNGNSLFALMHDIFSFGEAAVRKGNVDGASLAVLRLEEHIQIAEENQNDKYKQHVLEAMFRLGGIAAGAELKGTADFIGRSGQNIDDVAIERVAKHRSLHNLDHEAHEILVKSSTGDNFQAIRDYLRKAAKAFGSNLGMNLRDDDES